MTKRIVTPCKILFLATLAVTDTTFGFLPRSVERRPTTFIFQSSTDLGLTPELEKLTNAFEAIGDDKLRYKQLLYMASNGLDAMDESLKVDENKVLGCLSTVHVHATKDEEGLVYFTGDSDGLLTKGLVALLVRGLSGNLPEAIEKVEPSFIQKAGISQSLTPGRNNGFINMLALMKDKAIKAETKIEQVETSTEETEDGTIMKSAIMDGLQALKPTLLEVEDISEAYGNAKNSESHFQVTIVAEAFDGLNIIKRQQLVYMMLGEVMPKIEALQITARDPSEV